MQLQTFIQKKIMIKIIDPLNDGKSKVELLEWMGGDLSVVNDARASFDCLSKEMTDRDRKLIDYLIKHEHWSPFRSTVFKFRVKAPIFVCRQWWKHAIASSHLTEQVSHNERSFRYTEIDESGDFYVPMQFLTQSTSNRQASCGLLNPGDNSEAIAIYQSQCEVSFAAYRELIEMGVSREQARGILVPTVYTTWVWTVSLQALLNFISLRTGEGAQGEIAKYASAIQDLISDIVPVTLESWEKKL
jgi:thymidylate synthase (FAD)